MSTGHQPPEQAGEAAAAGPASDPVALGGGHSPQGSAGLDPGAPEPVDEAGTSSVLAPSTTPAGVLLAPAAGDPPTQAPGAGAPLQAGPSEPDIAAGPPLGRLARFRRWRFAPIVEVIATIALALALAESVQAAVVKPFVIPTGSMEPTLLPGQRVLVNRLAYDFGSPHRGDIVVFHPPNSLNCRVNVPTSEPCPTSNTTPSSQYFVKRVIGLPGDRLSIANGHPVINGRALTNEPYITPCVGSDSCDMSHTIVVPAGEYYMLGDNRGDSDDSRYWGPVPSSWIIGEVFATYWPLDRVGIF